MGDPFSYVILSWLQFSVPSGVCTGANATAGVWLTELITGTPGPSCSKGG